MNVGVGLPSAIPGTTGVELLEWARRAEERGFSCIGVVDRVSYHCFDPLAALAAAAAVTERIRLASVVAVGPLRAAAILAKQAQSVHLLSGGRMTLGLGIGARTGDYTAAGVDFRERGRLLDDQLVELRDHLTSGRWGPTGDGSGPVLLVGGSSDVALARMARLADGYVHGGGPPRAFRRAADRARLAWREYGRPGEPRLWGQGYFALGDDARAAGLAYMRDYYAFVGPFAERIAEGLLTTPQAVVQLVRGYEEEGCDELVLMPAVAEIVQLDRLARVLGRAS